MRFFKAVTDTVVWKFVINLSKTQSNRKQKLNLYQVSQGKMVSGIERNSPIFSDVFM